MAFSPATGKGATSSDRTGTQHPPVHPTPPPRRGLCCVPRYPSNPAPRHPRRGGVPVRGAISPGRGSGAGCFTTCPPGSPCSRFRVPGSGGATTRPGCFRPVCLFDTHRRRGLSMNTRPLSGVVGYRDTFPPLPVSFFRCFRVVDIGTPAPFRGFPFRGKHPPYRHRCRETFRGGILSRPTMAHGSPPCCPFHRRVAYRLPFRTSRPGHRVAGRGCIPPGHRCRVCAGVMSRCYRPGGYNREPVPPVTGCPSRGSPPGGGGCPGGRPPPGTPRHHPGGTTIISTRFLAFFGGIVTLPLTTPLYVPPSSPFWRVLLRCRNESAFNCKIVTKTTFKNAGKPVNPRFLS